MFEPSGAYQPLTEDEQKVSSTALIIPSGEACFFDPSGQVQTLGSGINALYDNGLSALNLQLIHKEETTKFQNDDVDGILDSKIAPIFGASLFSSAQRSKDEIPKTSMSTFNSYIHYYPSSSQRLSSLYNSIEEVLSSFNINYSSSFEKSSSFNPYN
jgi:hypothetical protein